MEPTLPALLSAPQFLSWASGPFSMQTPHLQTPPPRCFPRGALALFWRKKGRWKRDSGASFFFHPWCSEWGVGVRSGRARPHFGGGAGGGGLPSRALIDSPRGFHRLPRLSPLAHGYHSTTLSPHACSPARVATAVRARLRLHLSYSSPLTFRGDPREASGGTQRRPPPLIADVGD